MGISLDAVRVLLEGWEAGGLGAVKAVTGVRANPYSSRMSSAIAEVRTSSEERATLLVKRGEVGERNRAGAPWGSGYEGIVYRGLLAGIQNYASPFVGHLVDGADSWLVLRWIDGAVRVNKHPDSSALVRAATWLGRFHGEASEALETVGPGRLNRYADGIVAAWVELASAKLRCVLTDGSPVIPALAEAVPLVHSLLSVQETLVHGDFYPSNVLVAGSGIVPIDWEWAGVAAGEIDLASLVDGWPDSIAAACIEAYRVSRWPDGGGGDVISRVWAARFYLSIRSLGRRSLRPTDSSVQGYLHKVDLALNQLGLASLGIRQ